MGVVRAHQPGMLRHGRGECRTATDQGTVLFGRQGEERMMLWWMKQMVRAANRVYARAAMRWLAVLGLVGALAACAGSGLGRERDYFPGRSPYYSFGKSQSAENFANVKRAQTAWGLYP